MLGEIYSQALEAAGFKVKKQLNLGSELIAYKALKAGKVDAYPEYTGTALTSFFGVKTADVPKDANKAYEDTKAGFAKEDITALAADAVREHLPARHDQGGGDEDRQSEDHLRPQGQGGRPRRSRASRSASSARTACSACEDAYGLKFGKFVSSEQKYQVLDSGDADVAFIFTTDGDLAGGKYVVLDDDKKFFPPYNVTFDVRNEALKNLGPEGQKVIEDVQKPLTEQGHAGAQRPRRHRQAEARGGRQELPPAGRLRQVILRIIKEEHHRLRRTHPLLALLANLCLGFVFAARGGDDEKSTSSKPVRARIRRRRRARRSRRSPVPSPSRRSPSARRTSPSSSCSVRSTG